MNDFFLKHDVYKDKDSDEIGINKRCTNSDSEASDDEEAVNVSSAYDPTSPWIKKAIPEPHCQPGMSNRASNTGPKGVLKDYHRYKVEKKFQNEQNALIRQAVIDRITKGYITVQEEDETIQSCDLLNHEYQGEEDVEEDDTDDQFLEKFRLQRLEELKANESRPLFGEIKEVDPLEFVDIINNADPRVNIVVHLYEHFVPSCRIVNNYLEMIAKRHSKVQFLRLNASDADDTMDHRSLPVLLVYRGGDLVCTIADVVKTIEGHVCQDTVEWILESHNVFENV